MRLFESSPNKHAVHYFNVALGIPRTIRESRFDAIVLHTTLLCARWFPQFAAIRDQLTWLADVNTLKIALPQDEYDHSAILDVWLADLKVDVVGTNFDPEHRTTLYPRLAQSARFLKCLTGYIDAATASAIAPRLHPPAERPLDIVYRANHLPYWFGHHGQLKHEVAIRVSEAAAVVGLKTDISTSPGDTIQSSQWYDFLASGRATIGCESGSSAIDRRGELRAAIQRLLAARPGLSFEEVSAQLPPGWDSYRFFAIGPRHLEAIITRTCQILVEGEYDGILRPNEHYLPLRRDFGNLTDLMAMVRDDNLLERITGRAYEDVYLSGRVTYAAAAQIFEPELAQLAPTPRSRWSDAAFRVRLRAATIARLTMHLARRLVFGVPRRIARLSPFAPRKESPPARPEVTVP
jgi:hypothetical protein